MKKVFTLLLLCSLVFSSFAQPVFGVLVNSNGAFGTADKANMAMQLGVNTVRENIVLQNFTGTEKSFDNYLAVNPSFKFFTNLNWMQGVNKFPPPATYGAKVAAVAKSKYAASTIVFFLQNEELNPTFNGMSPDQYVLLMQIASDTLHEYGFKCANGGIYGSTLFVIEYRWIKAAEGQTAADAFGNLCLSPSQIKAANNPGSNKAIEQKVSDMMIVINGIRDYMDYCNVHFYNDPAPWSGKGVTSQLVWPQVKTYLEKYTGKPVIANETCIRNTDDPVYVTNLLTTFRNTNTKYVAYFCGEGSGPANAGSRSLFNPDKTIRPSGIAFTNTVKPN